MAESGIRIGTHAHPLILVNPGFEGAYFVCAKCRVQDNQQRYCCNTCMLYFIHVHCAVEIKKVEDKARQDDILCNVGIQVGIAALGGLVSAGVREGTLAGIHHVKEHGANATAVAGAAAPSEAVAGGGEAAVSEGASGAVGAADGAGAASEFFSKAADFFSNLPF